MSCHRRLALRDGHGLLLVAAVATAGCSNAGDELFATAGDSSGGAAETAGDDTDDPGGSDDGDTDAGPNTTSSTGGDSGAPDTDGPAGEDDCTLDCGEDALCQNENGAPQCVCFDAATQWNGSECLQCEPVQGAGYGLDLGVVDATFRVTLDGSSFPQSPTEHGRLLLRSRDSLDVVDLGFTFDDQFTATVLMGLYDVIYEHRVGGLSIPLNKAARVDTVYVDDAGVIEVDVPRTLVSAKVTINDEEPVRSPTNYARIILVNKATDEELVLTPTFEPERNLYLVPGAYDIRYRNVIGGQSVPRNPDAKVGEVIVPATDDVFELPVDIRMQSVSGSFFVNGELAPASPTNYGTVTLVNNDNPDDRIEVGDTFAQSYSANVVAGSYSFYYTVRTQGTSVPANTWGFVQSLDDGMDVRIRSVVTGGDIQIAGAEPPADGSNDGSLSLRTPSGDSVVLGNTRDGTFSQRVLPGSYEVFYSQESAGGLVPVNTSARLQTLEVGDRGATQTVNVQMVQLDGSITLNSQLPPDSEFDDGRLYLRNPETGDSVLLGNTRQGTFSKPVVPATYDLVYVVESAGNDVPVNTEALIARNVDVQGDGQLPVDIVFDRLTGSVTINGAEPMAAGASFVLEDVVTGDEVFLGTLDDPSFDESLAAGRYLARYRGGPDSYNGPQNSDAAFACIEISAPQ